MTERHLVASLVFRFLRPAEARSGKVDHRILTLSFRHRTEHIPLRYIASLSIAHDLTRSSLVVEHAGGTSILSGLPTSEATELCKAAALARNEWWNDALQAELKTLAALRNSIQLLEQPPSFITRATMERICSGALALSKNLAGTPPESLRTNPHFATLTLLSQLLQDPDRARKSANSRYIRRQLSDSRSFLDSLKSKPLTIEQRTAIVTDELHNLVVASAGSGKTSVILGKAAWLIQARHHQPSELLILAFARNARDEIENRLPPHMIAGTQQTLKVRTFHSLGLSIMGNVEGKLPSLSKTADDSNALHDLLKGIVTDLLADPEHSKHLVAWLQNRFAPEKSQHDFANLGEYYAYIRQYDLRSLQGEKVRSFEESEIANFLYLNGIPYEYEPPYEHDTATPDRRQYRPDFRLTEPGIYIEHFALDIRGRTPPFIDRDRYLSQRAWKRNLHASHGTTLIETYSHQHETGTLRRSLIQALTDRGVTPKPISPEQIFKILEEQGRIAPFIRLAATFIRHFKSAGLTYADLARRATDARGRERAEAFLRVFRPIHEAYQRSLHRDGHIDFNDMIHCAADYVETGKYRSPFQYILVDEFQDISPARARLVRALVRQSPNNRLFAVGDDWQAISRYAGADISIMRDFQHHFGDHEQLRLETTFRCPDRLANVATQFILKNPAQISKTVRSTTTAERPCVHLGLSPNPGTPLIIEALDRIRAHAEAAEGDPTLLILARYRHMLSDLRSLRPLYPSLQMAINTVHASKGLEADYVILIGLHSGKFGFPSEIVDDPLLNLVLSTPEPHSNAEERRLFYVALTRARRQVYLLADGGPPSPFAEELIHGGYDISIFGRQPEPHVPCPLCVKGKLKPRKSPGQHETFYGCSNYPYCQHTAPACPSCNTGLPTKTADGMECSNCRHPVTPCPRCTGWLRERRSENRLFLGCSSYPTCTHTQSLELQADTSASPSLGR